MDSTGTNLSERTKRRQNALARWDNEGGAGPDGPQRNDRLGPVIDPMLRPTDAELVQLRIRVIALENLMITLLAETSDGQRDLARDLADTISPRPGSTRHPLTIHAARRMLNMIERAETFRVMGLGPDNDVQENTMNKSEASTKTTIIPTLRYRDGKTAIDWLCGTFGFEINLVVPDKGGEIAHAQLTFGNGMIMLGSARNNEFHNLVKSPAESGGIGSQSVYIIVADIDQHYARTVRAGADIVMAIKDEDYGGRAYSCRDPEGHLWNFGSYDPWAA
jgi:uncharacterized glyoxalase superfamily protein PhnB